jgi:hypothetical protein
MRQRRQLLNHSSRLWQLTALAKVRPPHQHSLLQTNNDRGCQLVPLGLQWYRLMQIV